MSATDANVQAPDKIHGAMLAVMRQIGAIAKSKNNAQQGFKYRGIDQVYEAVHPLMCEHGIFMTSEIVERIREERTSGKGGLLLYTQLRMRYWFHAEDGSKLHTEVVGEGMDSGDKSSNKSMAVAHKYAILQAFCVPTELTDDPDKEAHEVAVHAKQQAPPKASPSAESRQSNDTFLDTSGPVTVHVLATEKRKDKKGKDYVAVKLQERFANGKSMCFCYRTTLFDVLALAAGEQCIFEMDSQSSDFPMIADVARVGDESIRDGKPEGAGFHASDDDIPF